MIPIIISLNLSVYYNLCDNHSDIIFLSSRVVPPTLPRILSEGTVIVFLVTHHLRGASYARGGFDLFVCLSDDIGGVSLSEALYDIGVVQVVKDSI